MSSGNTASAAPPAAAVDQVKPEGKKQYSWEKKKLDPKDFMFSKLKGQVCIKEPGSINGQQFIIEDCEDCDIYLCDQTATVQIDCCKSCRIFVGPTDSSIFIRNCEGCKCIFACQQYRARECKDCDTLLFSSTAPVIEMSSAMRFGCFRFFYFSLAKQFAAASLSLFDNKWSEIYDFTPNAAACNWSFLPLTTTSADLLKPLATLGSFVTPEEAAMHKDDEVVPYTCGLRKQDFAGQERAFLLFPQGQEAKASEVLRSESLPSPLALIQTKRMQINAAKAKQLLKHCAESAVLAAAGKGFCVGAEVAGPDALAKCKAALQAAGAGNAAYCSGTADAAAYEVNVYFEQWRDFAGAAVTK